VRIRVEKIGFGKLDDEWKQYGLSQRYIDLNDDPTGYKAILRNGEMVAIVREGYKLFPNEEAIKIADRAASLAGFDRFMVDVPGCRTIDNVIYSKSGHKVKALYAIQSPVTVDGDKVNVGVQVYNSIDGTSSFGCGLFTFRGICSNGIIFGKREIRSVKQKHTIGLQAILDELQQNMVLMMERAMSIVEDYRLMAQRKITQKLINKILDSRVPAKVLPYYVKEESLSVADFTEWDLYNDITELIWHNDRTALTSKEIQFTELHRVLPFGRII